jgi:hypothetical protein
VSNAIDPRSQRTSSVEVCKTAPQRQMDVLHEIASGIRVGLIRTGQSVEGMAEDCDRFTV